MSEADADFIIVGAGSSGCVLAARLSEDSGTRVLLIEAGGSEERDDIAMPLRWFEAMRNPALNWGYASEPEPHCDGRRINAPRGKVIGGCSSINGMMYSRGSPADYDQWAQTGARGWSHADVLPYFRKSERNWRGESAHHGGAGEISVARHAADAHVYPALIETAEKLGHRHLGDFHGDDMEGWSAPDFTVHEGRRGSPAARMLRPAMKRPNLRVISEALTTRVVIKGGRAVGIEYEREGTRTIVRAAREVILAAGTFNSPQILMLSGIGPAAALRDHDIGVAADLPQVGQNLQDHASIGMLFKASGGFTFDAELRLDRMLLSVLKWKLFGTGAVAGLPVGAQGFLKTREGLDRPDLQMLVSPVAMDARLWFPGWRQRKGDYFSVSNVLLHPESTGHVTLRSSDPHDKPQILFNLLDSANDRAAFRRFFRYTRRFLGTAPAADLIAGEVAPGPSVQSDDEIDVFVRRCVGTAMHPTSTCAIGPVVDPELRVHGVGGLRVVDCSVMPTIPGGNTNAPAIMVAEKAADMIRAEIGVRKAA